MKNFINKIVKNAKELERQSKLSNEEWVREQNYELDEEEALKEQWKVKQLSLQ